MADVLKYCRPEEAGVHPQWIEEYVHTVNENRKMSHSFVMLRGGRVFALNFHPDRSYEGYYLPVTHMGIWRTVFSTDRSEFGGEDRISEGYLYEATLHPDGCAKLPIYLPARTALCLERCITKNL